MISLHLPASQVSSRCTHLEEELARLGEGSGPTALSPKTQADIRGANDSLHALRTQNKELQTALQDAQYKQLELQRKVNQS